MIYRSSAEMMKQKKKHKPYPQLDGDLRRIRSGGELGTMYDIAMISIGRMQLMTKQKQKA